VLLLIRKLIDLPEPIVAEPVPTLVRLQLLNDCLGTWIDASCHLVEDLPRPREVRDVIGEDGKRRISFDITGERLPSSVGKGQF